MEEINLEELEIIIPEETNEQMLERNRKLILYPQPIVDEHFVCIATPNYENR